MTWPRRDAGEWVEAPNAGAAAVDGFVWLGEAEITLVAEAIASGGGRVPAEDYRGAAIAVLCELLRLRATGGAP